MQNIPNEILDLVLGYAHPTNSSPSRMSTTCGALLDTRHKSNHEPLLRGSTIHFAANTSSMYKELRTVFPSYYTRALFQTLYFTYTLMNRVPRKLLQSQLAPLLDLSSALLPTCRSSQRLFFTRMQTNIHKMASGPRFHRT